MKEIKKVKKILILSISLLMLVTSASCNSGSNDENNGTGDGKEKITVVLDWVQNTNHTGLYVAKELGYFDEAGIEVEIVTPPEDGAEVLVASNKAQFGISTQENVITAITADTPLPIKGVAALVQHNTSGIISLKSAGIESPKDLEGKRYATWDAPIEKAMMKDIVEKDGGDYSKVELVTSTVMDIVSALQTNVDAVWIFYGWDGIAAVEKGLDINYFSFRDIDPVFDNYTPIMISNESFLDSNPETAEKFLEAAAKGYEYAISKPEESVDILLKYAPEIDRNIALKSQEYLKEQYKAEESIWGKFNDERWQNFSDWLYEKGIISRKLEQGEGFTNEFLQ